MEVSLNQQPNLDDDQDKVSVNPQELVVGDDDETPQKMITPSSYGLLALFFGWLGIHDFSAGRYDYGCIHFIMTVIALCVFPFDISSFLPPTLLFASWLWAIWETIQFRRTNIVHMRTQETDKRDYVIKAKVTEFFTVIAIIAVATAIFFVRSMENCSGSGCSGPGWAFVLTVWVGTIPFLISIILLISGLVSYLKMPQELKKDKTLKNHTIAMCCLGFILLLATVILFIFFQM